MEIILYIQSFYPHISHRVCDGFYHSFQEQEEQKELSVSYWEKHQKYSHLTNNQHLLTCYKIHRAAAVQFNQNVTKDISKHHGIAVAASTICKQTLYNFHEQTEAAACTDFPQTYLEFKKQQKSAHYNGIEKAHEVIEMFVPEIKGELVESNVRDTSYTFAVPEGTLFVDEENLPGSYNKLQVDTHPLYICSPKGTLLTMKISPRCTTNFKVDDNDEGLSMEDDVETEGRIDAKKSLLIT